MEKHGFERVRVIGKGAFGAAILVRRRADGKKYVAKEVNLFRMKREEREEAKNEIKVLSKLNHPNIIRYEGHFEENSLLYIIMEYADGGDLDSRIKAQRGQPFREEAIMHYFVQVCMALKHLHDKRTLHRDLKGQNIFLTSNNLVKLGDFGISTILMNTNAQARTMCGTPYYFSPELCQNKPYNNKSDIWSLGCILYELTTLKHAFEGQNMKGLLQKIIRGIYPPVSSAYSNDIRVLIDSMLQRDPRLRPSVTAILRLAFVQDCIRKICGGPPPDVATGRPAEEGGGADAARRKEDAMKERLQREKERKELAEKERRTDQERQLQLQLEARRRAELQAEAQDAKKKEARLRAEQQAEAARQAQLRGERDKDRQQQEARKRERRWQGLGREDTDPLDSPPPMAGDGRPPGGALPPPCRLATPEEARRAAFWEGKMAAQRNKQRYLECVVGPPAAPTRPSSASDAPPPAPPDAPPPSRPAPPKPPQRPSSAGHHLAPDPQTEFLNQRRAAEANRRRICADLERPPPPPPAPQPKVGSPADRLDRQRQKELLKQQEERERERVLQEAYRQQRLEAERNRRRILAEAVTEDAPPVEQFPAAAPPPPSLSPVLCFPDPRRAASAPELSTRRTTRPLLSPGLPPSPHLPLPPSIHSPSTPAARSPVKPGSGTLSLSDSSDDADPVTPEDVHQQRQLEYRSMQVNMQAVLSQLQPSQPHVREDESDDFSEADDKIANLVALLSQCQVAGRPIASPASVSDSDPLMTRIEVLRQIVEDSLGVLRFKEVYGCLNNVTQDDDEDEAQRRALHVLSEEYVSFLPLILQLIFCEDEINIRANRCQT